MRVRLSVRACMCACVYDRVNVPVCICACMFMYVEDKDNLECSSSSGAVHHLKKKNETKLGLSVACNPQSRLVGLVSEPQTSISLHLPSTEIRARHPNTPAFLKCGFWASVPCTFKVNTSLRHLPNPGDEFLSDLLYF